MKKISILFSAVIIASILISFQNNEHKSPNFTQGSQFGSEVVTFMKVFDTGDWEFESLFKDLLTLNIPNFELVKYSHQSNYDNHIVGIAKNALDKKAILDNIINEIGHPQSGNLVWSINKNPHNADDISHAYLYLLKEMDENIYPNEIISSQSSLHEMSHVPTIIVKLNKLGSQKWAALTENAAKNNNFIAVLVDGEVISCPSVIESIANGRIEISGFENLEEADMLVQRIERSR